MRARIGFGIISIGQEKNREKEKKDGSLREASDYIVYHKRLGARAHHLGFQLSGIYLGFDKVAEELQQTGAISLWFRVDNIEATFKRLIELGARVKYPPTKKPWGDILAALLDPDGNIVGLAQR